MPGLPGGIWSTGRKGSFKMTEAAHRNAAREVRLGATNPGHSGLRQANTPSPATSGGTSEGTGSLPFAIPLQPTPKAHRSLSHSHGQREAPQQVSTGAGGPALPLGLLAEEENDTDSEDGSHDFGGQLTQTVSQPPYSGLQRASTYSAVYGGYYDGGTGRDQPDELGVGQPGSRGGNRGLEAAFANLAFGMFPVHLPRSFLVCCSCWSDSHMTFCVTRSTAQTFPVADPSRVG